MTKTVLITGATSGFGAAMARRFAEAGWRVVATGRRVERLRTLVDEFGAETIAAAAFDMRDEAAMNDTLSALPEPFQGIDVLINNAGLALGTAPAPEARLDDWLTMIEANVTGLVTLTHTGVPQLVGTRPCLICSELHKCLGVGSGRVTTNSRSPWSAPHVPTCCGTRGTGSYPF